MEPSTTTVRRSSRSTNATSTGSVPSTSPTKRSKSTSSTSPTKKAKSIPALSFTNEVQEDVKSFDLGLLSSEVKEADKKAEEEKVLLHPKMTYEFKDAKARLIGVDKRWESLINSLECGLFASEDKDTGFNPFKSLSTSIIGQQISWLAARSVTHRFQRLIFPHLPEKVIDVPASMKTPFPTPAQILSLDDPTTSLRSAGLSGRKAEYIIELATQFHDGRLNAEKLWSSSDEEVKKTLVAIRGIGPWTVDMFLIFSMKRPDIMPYGDLGVQKNMCKWYASDPESRPAVHVRKLASNKDVRASTPPPIASTSSITLSTPIGKSPVVLDAYPTPSTPSNQFILENENVEDEQEKEVAVAPTPNHFVFPTTSNNLTPEILKYRLGGKKLKGNIYLTPNEMEELSAPWRGYRSVACWYLWSLTDGTGDA